MAASVDGRIITFYSYKGGTGRSMALANIAWILASNRKRVLVLDWDLEAPGLHRYFRPFLLDKELTSSEGIIDFVNDYAAEAIRPVAKGETLPPDWYVAHADLLSYAVSLDWQFPRGGGLDFVPSGKQGPSYATRVNSFDWQNFYDRLGGYQFLEAAKARMKAEYDYILIDSRTGVSDTAGICTVQLPDDMVVCFTFNNQSIEGAAAVARSVYEQRRQRQGDRRFRIFPVPMRVDQAEQTMLNRRKRYAWAMFDDLMEHLPSADRKGYWGEVEVPYIPYFSYEEILATFKEEPRDPKLALAALLRITNRLTDPETNEFYLPISPERRQQVLSEFSRTPEPSLGEPLPPERRQQILEEISRTLVQEYPAEAGMAQKRQQILDEISRTLVNPPFSAGTETPAEEAVRTAEAVFAGLTPEEQLQYRRVLTRLVRVARPEYGGQHSKLRQSVKDLGVPEPPILRRLVEAHLLLLDTDKTSGETTVELAQEALIRNWKRLHEWISQDLEFLVWRQNLREGIQDWERAGRNKDYLLRGAAFEAARGWLETRSPDLNETEKHFIQAAAERENLQQVRVASARKRWRVTWVAASILLPLFLVIGYLFLQQAQIKSAAETRVQKILTAASTSTDPLEGALLCAELRNVPEVPGWRKIATVLTRQPIPQSVLLGHTDWVNSAKFSPDGQEVVTGSADGTARVWEAKTGKLLKAFQVDLLGPMQQNARSQDRINDVVFSGDGNSVMLASVTGWWTWNWHDEKGGSPGPHRIGNINSLALNPKKGLLATTEKDVSVSVWDLRSGKLVKTLTGQPGVINSVAFNPRAEILAAGGTDRTVRLWSLTAGRITTRDLQGHSKAVNSVAFSPDGNVLASGSSDRTARLWDVSKGGLVGRAIEHADEVNSVAFSPDGRFLATGCSDFTAVLWALRQPDASPRILHGHSGRVKSVAFSPDGKFVVTASYDGTARVWPVQADPIATTLSWRELPDYFRKITTGCLSPEQRKRLLGEAEEVARSSYRECENSFGRSGRLSSATSDVPSVPQGSRALRATAD
jgi:WD40 repeat protein/MinD-like ATPase involved in chromosome partitioning or flagellar assembly